MTDNLKKKLVIMLIVFNCGLIWLVHGTVPYETNRFAGALYYLIIPGMGQHTVMTIMGAPSTSHFDMTSSQDFWLYDEKRKRTLEEYHQIQINFDKQTGLVVSKKKSEQFNTK